MLERTLTLNPDSRHALVSLARTYAYMGDVRRLQDVSGTLEKKAQYNLDMLNTSGTLLVLQNNMRGVALIDHAIADNPDPPSRYYIGKFVAAMMGEDLAAAHAAIAKIDAESYSSVLSRILDAAYEARTGNLAAARASWEQAKQDKPILRVLPGAFLKTLPASPEVQAKLTSWLRPAVAGL